MEAHREPLFYSERFSSQSIGAKPALNFARAEAPSVTASDAADQTENTRHSLQQRARQVEAESNLLGHLVQPLSHRRGRAVEQLNTPVRSHASVFLRVLPHNVAIYCIEITASVD